MTTMHPVNSSNIHSIGYLVNGKELHVKFANGSTYAYKDVPPEVFTAMRHSESKMKFLNAEIKGKFEHRKIS